MNLRITGRAAVLALVAALALSGCSSDDGGVPDDDAATATATTEPTAEDIAALAAVQVDGDAGAEPTLTFDAPLSVTVPTTRVIDEGSGDPLEDGQLVGVHYVIVNGDGTRVGSTWNEGGDVPERFQLGDPQVSVVNMALAGMNVGARVLVANPMVGSDGTAGTTVFLLEAVSAETIRTPHTIWPHHSRHRSNDGQMIAVPKRSAIQSQPARHSEKLRLLEA